MGWQRDDGYKYIVSQKWVEYCYQNENGDWVEGGEWKYEFAEHFTWVEDPPSDAWGGIVAETYGYDYSDGYACGLYADYGIGTPSSGAAVSAPPPPTLAAPEQSSINQRTERPDPCY